MELRWVAAQSRAPCGHLSKGGGSSSEDCVPYLVTEFHFSTAQGFATKGNAFAKTEA